MAKRISRDPELKQAFKNCVDALGGKNCTNWTKVACYMKEQWNFYDRSGFDVLYSLLFAEKRILNTEEEQSILRYQLDNDFSSYALEQQSKALKLPKFRMRDQVVKNFRRGLQVFMSMFSLKKKQEQRRIRRYMHKAITILLNMYNAQEDEKIIQEMKQSSIIFRKLFYVYAENLPLLSKQRVKLYELLANECTRHQFSKILYHLDHLQYLRRIILKEQQDLGLHPELFPTIFQNVETTLFKKYVDTRDDGDKFKLFNQALVDTLTLQEINPQVDKKVFKTTVDKFQEKKKPRPRFGISKSIYSRNPRTVIFGNEADQIEENLPIDEVATKNEKLNDLYNQLYREAFQYEIELEKRRK